MKPIRNPLRDAVGAALLALFVGSCTSAAPGMTADPAARQKVDSEKQKELSEMEKAGRRD